MEKLVAWGMVLLARLAVWSELAFAVFLFLIQVAVHLLGFRLGQRNRAAHSGDVEGVGLIVGGILALLAFVLALTLSYANTRFAERRHTALQEANAIGTAWLRAEALDHPRAGQIARLLETYIRERKRFLQTRRASAELQAINDRTSSLQSEIWGHAAAISHERPDDVVASLMRALNEAFDMSTKQRFAHDDRYPPQMFWLLIGLTLISIAALGYQLGLKDHRIYTLVGILIAVWTSIIVVILDISTPRLGSIRTGIDVYDWTLSGFKGGIRIPPPPH
ncbi:MAG: hypothetical protein AB7O43_04275 [Hyphomicrobiaceae bacterium]